MRGTSQKTALQLRDRENANERPIPEQHVCMAWHNRNRNTHLINDTVDRVRCPNMTPKAFWQDT